MGVSFSNVLLLPPSALLAFSVLSLTCPLPVGETSEDANKMTKAGLGSGSSKGKEFGGKLCVWRGQGCAFWGSPAVWGVLTPLGCSCESGPGQVAAEGRVPRVHEAGA